MGAGRLSSTAWPGSSLLSQEATHGFEKSTAACLGNLRCGSTLPGGPTYRVRGMSRAAALRTPSPARVRGTSTDAASRTPRRRGMTRARCARS